MSTQKTKVNPSEEIVHIGQTGIEIRFLLIREDGGCVPASWHDRGRAPVCGKNGA